MCFSKVKLSCFNFYYFFYVLFFLGLFSFFNLCVQTSGHKVDGFHATFQGKWFWGVAANRWMSVPSFPHVALPFPGDDLQHLSGRVGEAAEGKPLQASASWWVNANLMVSLSACKCQRSFLLLRNRRGIPQLWRGQGTAPRGRVWCLHHRPLFHLNDQLSR